MGAAASRFRLLGRGGRWERHTIERDGRPVMHVDGWSFPSEAYLDDPLRGLPAPPGDSLPVLGLLHADLDQPASRYAPVALSALRAACHRLWVLGHIHKPALHEADGCAAVLYPGSPQGMDPGETGTHGLWTVDLTAGERPRPRHVPTCLVRYEEIEIDVTGCATRDALESRVIKGLRDHLLGFCEGCGPLELVSCRLTLAGRTPLHRQVLRMAGEMQAELELSVPPFSARVERIDVRTRPAVDLAAVASGGGAPALLAKLLKGLDARPPAVAVAGTDEAARVVDRLARELGDVWQARPYDPLVRSTDAEHPAEPPPDARRARALLYGQGLLLLDELLAQKGGNGP